MWNERYRESELLWSAGPNLFLPAVVDGMAQGSALDLACGEGRNAIWLARQGWDVTGVDFSPVGIEKARTIAGDTDVTWQVADATTFESASRFDLVIVFYLHLPSADIQAALSRAAEAVAPGGTLFAVGHAVRNAAEGTGGPPYPEILWSESSFDGVLDGLEVLELGERLRDVDGAPVPAIDYVLHATKPT